MTQASIPSALHRFLALYGRAEYWESHEVLEGPWREGRSGFYKGLILLASALVHVQRANPRGIVAQCRKAERELAPFRPHYLGIDVDGALQYLAALRAAGEAGTTPPPPPPLRFDPALVRGDEPELDPDEPRR